jgi:PAS domain S-box-containing protein
LTIVLGLVCAVALAGFAVMTIAVRDLRRAETERGQSSGAITTANELEQSVLDLETGLRGFLLGGRVVFLQPYDAALAQYPTLVRSLETATRGEPAERRMTVSIAAAIRAYVSGWAAPVIRRAQHDLQAARRAEAAGGGKARVDAMRTQFAVLLARESVIHSGQVGRVGTLSTLALASGAVAGGLFLALIVILALRTQIRVVAPLRRLAFAVALVTAGNLSVRVRGDGAAEVGELVRGFNGMAAALERQRQDLADHQDELEGQKHELEGALSSLEERNRHIELLKRFGDHLAAADSVQSVGAAALREMADASGCEVGAAYVLDPDVDVYLPVARRGLERADLAAALQPGEGLAGRALAERRAVAVDHDETTMTVAGLAQRAAARHELHVPILHGERTVGVISLGRLQDRGFSERDLRLVGDLAERAGVDWAQALATRQLGRTAHELQALLETTDQGVYGVDTTGQITLVNRAALEMTGFTREEMVGGSSHRLLHHTRADGAPYPEEECPVHATLLSGEGARIGDEVFWRRDGTSFPVEYSVYPLFEEDGIAGAVVTFFDRTAHRQAERHRDTQHALARIFAEVPSLAEARPQMLAAVCQGLGFDVGLSWDPTADPGTLSAVATYAEPGYEELAASLGGERLTTHGTLAGRAVRRGDPVLCTDLERDPPRPNAPYDARVRTAIGLPVRALGGRLVAVAEFFSSRLATEDGLLDTLRAIGTQVAQHVERQRAEEESQRMKDQIVANVSHELRTPLTAIHGWIEVLLGEEPGPLTDEQRRFLEIVKRNSDRLMRLVGDLLVAGRIEAGKLKLELEPVDVADLAHETAEHLGPSAESKQIALTVVADEPVVVRGDRQRLGQLLSNLVSNAIKFTPEAGAVELQVQPEDGLCRVTVSDTGIGIRPDEREHLFERFYRTPGATERGITGTGLGLAISKAIADSHDGRLRLADHVGPGTVFVVELPLYAREEALR